MKNEVKKKKRSLSKQEMTLLGTFIFLVILVIVLIIVALNMKNIAENEKSNITIPILEENSQSEISVDLSDMKAKETKEYIFTITNYKDGNINEEDIKYNINITGTETVNLKLYKNNSEKNILEGGDLIVKNNKLVGDKKKEDTYHLIIETIESPEKDEKITIKINS